MASMHSFWADLFDKKLLFKENLRLVDFPYCKEFSNLSIVDGEGIGSIGRCLIQLKDSGDYQIPPFVSIIPTKDRYYLVRGRREKFQKICLVYGSFFETIPAEDFVNEAFSQILDESLGDLSETEKEALKRVLPLQKILGRVGSLEKSSVTLQYQMEIEILPQANILNPKQYPEILDDTLNFVCPFHTEDEKEELISKMESVMGTKEFGELNIIQILHPLNGPFLVFQTSL